MNRPPFVETFRKIASALESISSRVKTLETRESFSMSQINSTIEDTITIILEDEDHDPLTLAPGSPGILIGQELDLTGFVEGGEPFAIHDNVDGEIAAITEKSIPASSDLLLIEDSDEDFAKKFITVDNFVEQTGSVEINSSVYGFASHVGTQANEHEDDNLWMKISNIYLNEGTIFVNSSSTFTIGDGIYIIHIYQSLQNLDTIGSPVAQMTQTIEIHQRDGETGVVNLRVSCYENAVELGRVISASGQLMVDGSLGNTIRLRDLQRVCGSTFTRHVYITIWEVSPP